MKIASCANNTLFQLNELISQLSEEEITLPLEVFSGSSIGQHTRHILEFYICLLQQASSKSVCYDKRERNSKLENDKESIQYEIHCLITKLDNLTSDYNISVVTELGESQHATPSSLSREILYTIEHAVHLMAILKIGVILNFKNVVIPPSFGVAESTIRYIKEQ